MTRSQQDAREVQDPALEDAGAGPGPAGGRSRLALGLVALLAVLPYLNSFPNTFVFDDKIAIVENRLIRSLRNIPTLLATGYWSQSRSGRSNLYRPLATISYALNYALGGLHPFGYHLVNVLTHLGVSLLLYRLALRLFRSQEGALLAAALFAVHPLHTEAVTGIVGRAELLAAVFFLLAWWWYMDAGERPRYTLPSLGALALALLSKENALTLPGVLILYEIYVAKGRDSEGAPALSAPACRVRDADGCPAQAGGDPRPWNPGVVWRYAAYVGVLIGYFTVRVAVFGGMGLPLPVFLDNPLAHVGPIPRVLTALEVAGRYLLLMLWPGRLSPDYSYNQIPVVYSPWSPGVVLAGLAWGGLIGLACWSYRGKRRAFLCVGFTLVTFSTTSNILAPIGTMMGERLFYLPSAGLCLLAGVAWQRLLEWRRDTPGLVRVRRVGLILLATIVVLLSGRTVLRNRDWRDHATLFERAVEVAPNSAKVRFNLGGAYLQKERYDDAMRELQASLAIYPSAFPHRNLGTLYLRKNESQMAMAEYRKALELDPRDGEAYNNLGYVLLSQGSIQEAIEALETAVVLEPTLADAHYTLGRALAEQERWPEAIAAYHEARRLKPDFMEAAYALGLALEASGEYRAAAEAFEEALRLKPGLKMAHRRLAALYRERLGDPTKAKEHSRQAGEGRER